MQNTGVSFTLTGSVSLSLSDAEDKVFDIELDMTASIAGVVRSEEGKPVGGVFVQFVMKRNGDQGRSLTDSDGRFLCTTMSGGGDYVPEVFPSATNRTGFKPARGSSFPTVTLAKRSSHVEGVELLIKHEQLEIHGRVVDSHGEAVADARVGAMSVVEGRAPEFAGGTPRPAGVTDTRGAFSIRALTAGEWALQAIAPDMAEGIVPRVQAGAKDVVITLQPRGGIDGTLVGFRERPIVYAQASHGARIVRGQVRGDRFSIQVPEGSYVVTAMSASEGDAQRVEVKQGARSQVTMTKRGRGSVTGIVTEHRTHTPVPDLRCGAAAVAGAESRLANQQLESAPLTNAQGRFMIDPSPAGEVEVICFSISGEVSIGTARANVPEGERASVTVEVARRAQTEVGDFGLTLDFRNPTPIVLGVRRGSAADGQLVAGDVIVAVDGEPTTALTTSGVQMLIENHPPGSSLSVTVERSGLMKSFSFVADSTH